MILEPGRDRALAAVEEPTKLIRSSVTTTAWACGSTALPVNTFALMMTRSSAAAVVGIAEVHEAAANSTSVFFEVIEWLPPFLRRLADGA
jgi:hypothetical protein